MSFSKSDFEASAKMTSYSEMEDVNIIVYKSKIYTTFIIECLII